MVNPSSAYALNDRALRASKGIEYWTGQLRTIMQDQGAELYPSKGEGYHLDDDLPITIRRGDLRAVILGLREHMTELKEFAKLRKPPTRSAR
jgi:hypothetical protein